MLCSCSISSSGLFSFLRISDHAAIHAGLWPRVGAIIFSILGVVIGSPDLWVKYWRKKTTPVEQPLPPPASQLDAGLARVLSEALAPLLDPALAPHPATALAPPVMVLTKYSNYGLSPEALSIGVYKGAVAFTGAVSPRAAMFYITWFSEKKNCYIMSKFSDVSFLNGPRRPDIQQCRNMMKNLLDYGLDVRQTTIRNALAQLNTAPPHWKRSRSASSIITETPPTSFVAGDRPS